MGKIKPTFKKLPFIIRSGLIFLFPPITIFIVCPIGYLVTLFLCDSVPLVFLIGYLISIWIVCNVFLRIYRGITFEISPETVTYNLDFLWSKRKTVPFINVKEIELKIGPFQKFFDLGTVVIHTQAASNTEAGLALFDIEDPIKIYELLKENMSKAKREQ